MLTKRPVVVCSPLLALIQDQVDSLNAKSESRGCGRCAVSLAGAHSTPALEARVCPFTPSRDCIHPTLGDTYTHTRTRTHMH